MTTSLDRSTLDQKDRSELQTIAQAMGGKVPTRLRKSEIVDLILNLAGIDPDAPSGGNGSRSKSSNGSAKAGKGDDAAADTADAAPDAGDANGSDSNGSDSNGSDSNSGGSNSGDAKGATLFDDTSSDDTSSDDKSTDADADTRTDDATSDDDAATDKSGDNRNGSRDRNRGENRDRDSRGDRGDRGDRDNRGDRGGRNRGDNRDNKNDRNDRGDGRGGDNRGGDNRGGQNKRGDNDRKKNDRNRNNDGRNNNNDNTEPGNRKRRRRGRGNDRDDDVQPWDGEPVDVEGFLDLRDEGYGFLRVKGSLPSKDDVYVPVKFVRSNGLRRGDHLKGKSRPANRNEKNPALLELTEVNGGPPEKAKERPKFDDLTPLFPDEKLTLERADDSQNMTPRIIDLISPIGKGQRGLIVSPPKAGKTTIVKEIVRSIEVNNPEVKVLVLLVDERPEEVTDMKRWLVRGEVVASTFDRPSDQHTAVAEMTIERAKRMVEFGDDVVIVLDGITRLARAYNLAAPATGRIMSGGVDSGALYPPKRFFGAARNVEEGGSLTIIATALVETGSKMDEVIFEEFKGTGNMELRLDRRTAERRIYPAIDVDASSTRHEELLFERKQLNQVWKLRRVLSGMANDDDNSRGNAAGLELLIDRLKTFATNGQFLDEVARGPVSG